MALKRQYLNFWNVTALEKNIYPLKRVISQRIVTPLIPIMPSSTLVMTQHMAAFTHTHTFV